MLDKARAKIDESTKKEDENIMNRYFEALDNFESEGRIFKKGEVYTAYFRENMYTLVAENGEFNFTTNLMDRVAEEWKDMFKECTSEEVK